MPSMVTTCLPETLPNAIKQLVTLLYSIRRFTLSPIKTVQAPQSPSLQPILVPISLWLYRIKSSKVVPGCRCVTISLSFKINFSNRRGYCLKVIKNSLKYAINIENTTGKPVHNRIFYTSFKKPPFPFFLFIRKFELYNTIFF